MKKLLSLTLFIAATSALASPIDDFNSSVKIVDNNEFTDIFYQKVKDQVASKNLDSSQYIVAVDRNPKNQKLSLVYFDQARSSVDFSRFSPVSTGDSRKKHYITPTGWFENSVDNGSYRAQGTKNQNGIRGYGRKGMRVWDMGWQDAQAGWTQKPDVHQIRFQMHATDPDVLQQRLGTPQSEGCVRIDASVNTFFDKRGVIDKNFEEASYWALAPDRTPVENAGKYILVIDTAEP